MKNKITVILAALLSIVMLVSLVACNKDSGTQNNNGDTTPAVTTTEQKPAETDPIDDVTTTEQNVEDEEPEETETGLQATNDGNDLGFGEIEIFP